MAGRRGRELLQVLLVVRRRVVVQPRAAHDLRRAVAAEGGHGADGRAAGEEDGGDEDYSKGECEGTVMHGGSETFEMSLFLFCTRSAIFFGPR